MNKIIFTTTLLILQSSLGFCASGEPSQIVSSIFDHRLRKDQVNKALWDKFYRTANEKTLIIEVPLKRDMHYRQFTQMSWNTDINNDIAFGRSIYKLENRKYTFSEWMYLKADGKVMCYQHITPNKLKNFILKGTVAEGMSVIKSYRMAARLVSRFINHYRGPWNL